MTNKMSPFKASHQSISNYRTGMHSHSRRMHPLLFLFLFISIIIPITNNNKLKGNKKDELTVELIEAAVPIPITVKGDDIKVLESREEGE